MYKVRVCIPTHSESISVPTADVLLGFQRLVANRDWDLSVSFYSGPVIHELRNLMVADALIDKADVLIMIDSDQGFAAEALVRWIDSGRPVVGCFYPKRRLDWSRVGARAAPKSLEAVLYQASEFVGTLVNDGRLSDRVEVVDGYVRAAYLGAGALVIRKEVLERLCHRFPDLAGRGFSNESWGPLRAKHNWGFFNPIVQANGRHLSEDAAFCHRWRKTNGEIWADVAVDVVHVGRYNYSGRYLDYLKYHQDDKSKMA